MTLLRTSASIGVVATALMAAMAASATAQELTNVEAQNRGFYAGAGLGVNLQEDNNFRGGGADSTAHYDAGGVGIFSLGYALGNGLRFEVEPGYRRNEVDSISGVGGHGHTSLMTLMGNAIYDIPYRVPGNMPFLQDLLPHVGVGAGVARAIDNSLPHAGLPVTGNETVGAYQAIAGLEYAITPGLKAGIDYRYLLAHDVNFHVATTGAGTKAGDFNDHSILLTLRYEFGTPARPRPQPAAAVSPPVTAPPAAPATPPAPVARNYAVYFALDSAVLTPTAREIVRQAAANAKPNQTTRLAVTGYADTTGKPAHNQKLSEQRAAAVRAELIAAGIPADEIATSGRGESDLAVPTAQNVNEPRNRRVVIVQQGPGS